MKVSLSWLADYVELKADYAELAQILTMAGLEIEAIEKTNDIPDGIVVAEIIERKPHPNADKLSVCRVSSGRDEWQIVCGAPNCNAGSKVPLATLGAVLTDKEKGQKLEIKKCKLRGIESYGMLCSSRELGLDGDHSGLLILPSSAVVGTPLKDILKPDIIYTVEITPNRPDWLSHWGVARDIAALIGGKLKFPAIKIPAPNLESMDSAGLVEVRDSALCPRYTGRVFRGIKVKESPGWLKDRLVSVGLRPINNIVDITNFVMLELGQPLHAFDLDLLAGRRVVIRRAADGEKITTLDGKERSLKNSHLVIADAEKPVALAGVMGGEHSGVNESTVNILLESAAFLPTNIRATSRELGISSDSSYRFERGIDYEMVKTASDRAAALIVELAGGEPTTDLVDIAAPRPQATVIECRCERIRALLGIELDDNGIVEIFRRLGLDPQEPADGVCNVKIPSFRLDLEREADLAEEVARIHGLAQIPVRKVSARSGGTLTEDAYAKMQQLRDELVALGLTECVTCTLIEEKAALAALVTWKEQDLLKVSNPISLDLAVLRPSLLPAMMATVERNVSRKASDLALFELGNVFCANPKIAKEERLEACIALTGRRHPERFSAEREEIFGFFDMKGLLEELLERRRIVDVSFRKAEDPRFSNGVCAAISTHGKDIALFGQLSAAHTAGMRLSNPLWVALLDLSALMETPAKVRLYEMLSPYPSTSRDVAFVADESLEHSRIVEFIQSCKLKNLENIELFDVFQNESLGPKRRSMAYSLTFRHPERTLTDSEVNEAHEELRKKLAAGLGIELR
ncbi:MAG: phenylalanine--tRNA ligase subunit beta [Lentisphaerae bacterium GWF2_52_8]|nr:MAG: phenylalanine--tRNA ligase subunit beta [Lentisphaerae bacterium GWF2_52_8]